MRHSVDHGHDTGGGLPQKLGAGGGLPTRFEEGEEDHAQDTGEGCSMFLIILITTRMMGRMMGRVTGKT